MRRRTSYELLLSYHQRVVRVELCSYYDELSSSLPTNIVSLPLHLSARREFVLAHVQRAPHPRVAVHRRLRPRSLLCAAHLDRPAALRAAVHPPRHLRRRSWHTRKTA